jgi:hypothetical protein
MGRQAIDQVKECFRYYEDRPGYQRKRAAECRYCPHIEAENTTRQACHLAVCVPYLRYKLGGILERGSTARSRPIILGEKLSAEKVSQINALACLMIYQGNLPFNFFERPEVQAFLSELRPAYKPLSKHTVANRGLQEAYEAVKTRVDKAIAEESHLNITFDAATDISHQRILNVSVGTRLGSFYYTNAVLGSDTVSAEYQCQRLIDIVSTITGSKFDLINAISGDTCSTMLRTFDLIAQSQLLKHAFMIPCDAHGLQLLLGDILEFPGYSSTVEACDAIVSHLHHADKQYQILKDLQLQYPPHKSLSMVSGCKTRWSSQHKQYKRIYDSQMALRAWRIDPRITIEINKAKASDRIRKVAEVLMQPRFFESVAEIIQVIGPIVDEITKAEGDDCHIGLVIPRWRRVWDHLRVASIGSTVDWTSANGLMVKLNKRYQRQITPLHTLAFWLLPRTILDHNSFDQHTYEQTTVLSTIRRYTTEQDYPAARDAFLNYYTKQDAFSPRNEAWECADNPKVFWQLYWDSSPALAALAIRLWNTIANEVPCERAFSTLRNTKSKIRNRLTDENVDKLLFIHINTRVFARKAKLQRGSSDDGSDDDSDDEVIMTPEEEELISEANTSIDTNGQGMES